MGSVTRRILQASVLLGLLCGLSPALAEQWMNVSPLTDDQLASASGRQGVTMQ